MTAENERNLLDANCFPLCRQLPTTAPTQQPTTRPTRAPTQRPTRVGFTH